MRNKGYETKTAVFQSRNITVFPRKKVPADMEAEYIRKLQQEQPARTVMIFPDGSIGYADERIIPPQEPRARETKNYEQYNPLFDDISVLRRD